MKEFRIENVGFIEKRDGGHPLTASIKVKGGDDMEVSDGYHTMDELYNHRITLFIALCNMLSRFEYIPAQVRPWRSLKHHPKDKDMYEGWFVMGIGAEAGDQITYHLPLSRWDETSFAETLEHAPEWDGHSSDDVIERLKNL